MPDLDATHMALVGSHLVARMPDDKGRMKDTEIDLNQHIGINDDKLEWGGDHFFDGPDASFFLEDDQNEPVLRAMVRREDGEAVASAIELAERIRNEDGNLVFSMSP